MIFYGTSRYPYLDIIKNTYALQLKRERETHY